MNIFSIVVLALLIVAQCNAVKVYFWEHSNYEGEWFSVEIQSGQCSTFSESWNDRVSSLNAQENCILLWEHSHCRGKYVQISSHHNHLSALDFNDVASSFQLCSSDNSGNGGSSGSDNDIAAVSVNMHNKFRRRHNARDLVWDSQVAADAQRWANHLASTSQFHHSGNGHGENIAANGGATKQEAIRFAVEKQWYDEVKNYNFENPEQSNGVTGHFTQVVWKGSKKLGVGIAYDKNKNWWVVVANYSPPGNVGGQYRENVERARI